MRLCLLALLLVACGPGPDTDEPVPGNDDPCAPPGAPTLAIGLGLSGYEPLEEGDPIPLIHGSQGGFHLEIGLQATNLAADGLVSAYMEGEIDGVVRADTAARVDLRCRLPDAPVQESWGTLLVFNEADPAELDGKLTTIRVEVTDLDENVVSAVATFVIDDTGGADPTR